MRNLTIQLVHRKIFTFMDEIESKLLECRRCIANQSNNEMYLLLGDLLYVMPFTNTNFDILDFSFQSDFNCYSKIVAMEYCVTLQELYCAFESGYILKVDIKNRSRIDYDVATSFDTGLQCMKFSPDHEIIVVVTGSGSVSTMVLDFQVMSEVDLYSKEFGQDEFVNVGWGKKETQFHGSLGKEAAQVKPEQLTPNKHDDGCIQISWHESGLFFAVSFLHRDTKIRKFKVFNREGILCCTSEQLNGLEQYMIWNPVENLLAVSQILNDKYIIALIEKNGLKYADFLLPFTPQEVRVKNLLWSLEVLAVVCHHLETNTTLILLWIENNNCWYLKHTLAFPVEAPLLYVTWGNVLDATDKTQLMCLTTKELAFYTVNRCLNHSRGKTIDDKVVCGVINGKKILVTAFKDGIVPPPMAHQALETFELQNAIAFAPNINNESSLISSNDFCTISYNNKLTFFKQIKESCTLTYKIVNSCSIVFDKLYNFVHKEEFEEINRFKLHHLLWFTEDTILCSINTEKYNFFCVLSLDKVHFKDYLRIQKVHVLDFPVQHIISSDANTAYIKISKQIFKYTLDGKFEQVNILLKENCLQMEVIKLGSKDIILALSVKNGFFIDGKQIAENITNFYVHSDFLLLTTLQHTLICVSLSDVGIKQLSKHDLTVRPWLNDMREFLCADIYIRRIERRSIIIAAMPYDSKIIFQMPRGNLECVQPRALALHLLKYYLNNCDYLSTFNIMTKQRINLNLIYDHNPQLFLDNVEKFIEDIIQHKKLNLLNLFLSELQEDDVSKKMYAYSYADRIVKPNVKSTETVNKVDKICKLLRDIMEKRQDADHLIQPILISLVKNKQTKELENALSKIKQMKMLEDSRRLTTHAPPIVSVHETLKFLLHFVSIDVLYNVALGMYDLELAMFIASKSSKDPKEYISFLNNLKKLDQNYMKYSIDIYLKRYESALEHLSKDLTKFEECLNLICSQKLHKMAMKLFKKNTTEYRRVAGVYGELLLNEHKYSEAGVMFYKSGNLDKALKSYIMSCDNWEDVITISKEMKLSLENLYPIYTTLVENLKVERKYEHAAVILREYLNDVEEAIALLCEARLWKRALRIITDVQRLDLNETHIKPGLKEHAEYVISQLDTMKKDFLRYKSRLAIVRSKIEVKQLLYKKLESECNKEVPDSIDDKISTVADSTLSQISRMSISSSKSYRSSKNRRKQERKLFSLKEGSMFEDLSLIHALYQIINNAYKDKDEWYQLVQMLMRFEFDERAEKISVEAREFFHLVENSKSEIWNKSAPTSLTDIEKNNDGNYTQSQFQEMIAPIKLIERYVTHPPEVDAKSELIIF